MKAVLLFVGLVVCLGETKPLWESEEEALLTIYQKKKAKTDLYLSIE